MEEFTDRGCDVLGISSDDIDTHIRWLNTPPAEGGLGPIAFPLAADPDGATCTQYGVYIEKQKVTLRGCSWSIRMASFSTKSSIA